jgi:hypothetical protein
MPPYQRQLTLKQYLAAEHIGVDVVEGSQHIPEKRLAAHGHRRRTVITLPYFGAATRCHSWNQADSYRTPTIRNSRGRKSQNQGAEGAGRDNRLQVSDDLASESQYGCRARMASRRDQENWQEDRLMIFLSTESDCATVASQAILSHRQAEVILN